MVEIDLGEQVIIVTGAAGGIGASCVELLAEAGAEVVALDIDASRLAETYGDGQNDAASSTARLRSGRTESNTVQAASRGGIHPIACDLTSEADVRSAVEMAGSLGGRVSGLVHCAGIISYRKSIASVSSEEWHRVMSANLASAYLICREIMEPIAESRGGSIVLFSSLAAQVGGIEVGIHYAASKAGLIGFARSLAKEGGPKKIRVNTVAPGIIGTPPVLAQIADHRQQYEQSIPLRRIAEPRDVAETVLFLCSDLSRYITGATINVNGGIYMG